jgi:hypothetical protein
MWTNAGTRCTMDQGPGAAAQDIEHIEAQPCRRCGLPEVDGEGDGDAAMSGEPELGSGRRQGSDAMMMVGLSSLTHGARSIHSTGVHRDFTMRERGPSGCSTMTRMSSAAVHEVWLWQTSSAPTGAHRGSDSSEEGRNWVWGWVWQRLGLLLGSLL